MSDKRDDPPPPTERTIIRPARPIPAAGASPPPGFPPPQGFPPQAPPPAAGGGPDRTMVSPSASPQSPPPSQQPYTSQGQAQRQGQGAAARLDFATAEPDLYGPEPLVAAAGRLIHLASQLRTMPVGPDLPQLRQMVIRELDAFRVRAQALGLDPKTAPIYSQMLVGMVAYTGQWWLETQHPKKPEVAAHLVNLAWNGLSGLEARPKLLMPRKK